MSVPYETAAYEPPESPESPEEHLARLLGRALNSFELPDETIRQLDCALAHDSSLHSAHYSSGLHRATYRHTWLLADGSAVTMWELVHNTVPGSDTQHEVYTDEEELRAATARLPLPPDAPDFELPTMVELAAFPEPRHEYALDDSADHAHAAAAARGEPGPARGRAGHAAAADRVRARDHPGLRPPAPSARHGRPGLSFSLYEHAFLLADGQEVSLWEVEHTATPDGRHMCEVYASEDAARDAMERRAGTLG